jgi:excisionase family DNA binding protein
MDEPTTRRTAGSGVSGAPDTWPLTARDAAAVLGVSERTDRRAIARGELPAAKHAGVYRIAPAAIARDRTLCPDLRALSRPEHRPAGVTDLPLLRLYR